MDRIEHRIERPQRLAQGRVERVHRAVAVRSGMEHLAGHLRTVLGGASAREEAVVEAVNRRGRTIACTTTILPLLSPDGADGNPVRGAIVLMEDAPGDEGDQ